MKKSALFLPILALAMLVPAAPAAADTVSLTLTDPVQSGPAGSTLTFDATVTAPLSNGGTLYLNGDSFGSNFPGPNPIDDSGFWNNFFPVSFNPGDSVSATLFTVALPAGLTPGIYDGYFTITGGPDFSSADVLATANFEIDASPVPEPASFLLLAIGVAFTAALVFRRRHVPEAL